MAWSEKLRSGRYRGVYRDRQGQRGYTEHTYTQPSEAKAEAQRLEDRARNRPAYRKNAGKLTWSEWHAEWWPKRGVEASTNRSDGPRIAKHILPRWGQVALEDIDRADVQQWVDELADTRLSASTVHKIYSVLSASLKAAVIDNRIAANPCVSITLPTIPPGDEHYLERDEYAALREALPEERWRVLCDLLVYTGMRWGEATVVHRSRIHPSGRLDVHDAYDASAKLIKPYPKSKKKRSVPLTAELLATLNEWMRTPERCSAEHAKGSTCRGGLLLHDDGQVLDYFHFEKYVWRRAVKKSGIGHTTIHDLRHTYASWLIQQDTTLDKIQILLGHASPQTTQRYAHLVDTHWDSIRSALGGSSPDAAPHLPRGEDQQEGGDVIDLGSRRRSTGS